MKNLLFLTFLLLAVICFAQQSKNHPLPAKTYNVLHDSTTSVDVVLFHSSNSLSLDGKNVHVFNSFFERETAAKTNVAQAGTIMWQIDGREFLSGKIFLGDSTGYVITNLNGMEYVNLINTGGNSFFKKQINK